MATPVVVQRVTATTQSSAPSVTFPAPPTPGNVLVALILHQTAFDFLNGWDRADAPDPGGGTTLSPVIAMKVAGVAEPAAQTITTTANGVGPTIALYEISGLTNPGDPASWVRDVQWRGNTGFAAPYTGSPLTADLNDSLALLFYAFTPVAGTAPTVAAPWTQDANGATTGTQSRRYVNGSAVLATPGTITPAVTIASATAAGYVAVMIADGPAEKNRIEITQGGVLALEQGAANVRVTQAGAMALYAPRADLYLTQGGGLILVGFEPANRITQAGFLVLADAQPCVTQRCQIWTIMRRDGVVLRFTSLDRDLILGDKVFKSCASLNPSASENASTLGSVGNIELDGIIDDDAISEEDLYGGLYDDAYVTVDLVGWGSVAASTHRLASGWTGELSQGESGFKMEVLGAGSRLDQQALVQMVTPGCRWTFGDSRCTVDREALLLTGVVTASVSRSEFQATLSGGDGGLLWANGTVRFTSGLNDGQVLEVREVDFGAGAVSLWPSAAYQVEPGDTFDLLPGCDKAKTGGCTIYANVINFGGFSDVPGQDAILETPDAQY